MDILEEEKIPFEGTTEYYKYKIEGDNLELTTIGKFEHEMDIKTMKNDFERTLNRLKEERKSIFEKIERLKQEINLEYGTYFDDLFKVNENMNLKAVKEKFESLKINTKEEMSES